MTRLVFSMQQVIPTTLLSVIINAGNLQAQTIGPAEMMARGEIGIDTPYAPRTLESLVGSSTLIVRGRYGDFLSNDPFWGLGETFESVQARTGLADADIDQLAAPVSRYEILIDEVLLGDINASTVVMTIMEQAPVDRKWTDPTPERLLFLTDQGEGSYGYRGPTTVLTLVNGRYTLDERDVPETARGYRAADQPLNAIAEMAAAEFEQTLLQQIAQEKQLRQFFAQ
ncbi:MAG: hypothetical protein R3F41_00820 [Gammaproteobacteria bacterium]|nr:hypothetical protein [Pseudomonadales bacterium]